MPVVPAGPQRRVSHFTRHRAPDRAGPPVEWKVNVEVLPPGLRSQPAAFLCSTQAPGVDRIPGAEVPDTLRQPTSAYDAVCGGF